jgi:hypothetical protein
MAIPPEPIEDVLRSAVLVVDAEVTQIVSTGPATAKLNAKPGSTSTGAKSPSQTVKLTVKRVLHGPAPTELVVEKPEAGYALRVGNQGPFLIDASNVILGRYGPDSYSVEKIERALKK